VARALELGEGGAGGHLLDDVHALDDLAEHDVLVVEPARGGRAAAPKVKFTGLAQTLGQL
jgi:hypothetical protein